ncbi:MAG: PHP-associated domain-containing protein [Planctomycetota bacterium]|jgi:predicted metal-dependent phosphoesterase TrpH|nr:PHP-associated domain-containing protein [Planctomycetota bacterium]
MKRFDLHNHTRESNNPPEHWIARLAGSRECYLKPQDSHYHATRVRGLDGLAITNHDSIDDAMAMQDRHPESVIAGCEYTVNAGEGYQIHVVVLDINRTIHRELDRARHLGLEQFVPIVREAGHPYFLAHVAWSFFSEKPLTPETVERWILQFDCLETRNSTRMLENVFATRLARYYGKYEVGGSDGHELTSIGRAWTESPTANSKEEFLEDLKAGRVRPGGEHGSVARFRKTILRLAAGHYRDQIEEALDSQKRGAFLQEQGLGSLLRIVGSLYFLPNLWLSSHIGAVRHQSEMQVDTLRLTREFRDYLRSRETERILSDPSRSKKEQRDLWEDQMTRIERAFGHPLEEGDIDMKDVLLT